MAWALVAVPLVVALVWCPRYYLNCPGFLFHRLLTEILDTDRPERGGYAIRDPLPLPTEPPYTAHVGNLSFEATADDISDLFTGCGVTNVRIVEDKLTKAPKGFGYVEFETVEGLQKALDLSGTTLQGRTIRTSIAEPRKYQNGIEKKRECPD